MNDELNKIQELLFKPMQISIFNILPEKEANEYVGCNFESQKLKFKFRKAKITPKKTGQFVTLWKRNVNNITEPFTEFDNFDFYIIVTQEVNNYGLFLFPKTELVKQHILTTNDKEGKRGFRVYPNWTKTENKQAEKTQKWQSKFFIDFNIEKLNREIRIQKILNNNV